jgi:hypothetical protein
LEDQGLDGRISEFFLNTLERNVDWIYLAKDGDKRRGLVDTNKSLGSMECGEFIDELKSY